MEPVTDMTQRRWMGAGRLVATCGLALVGLAAGGAARAQDAGGGAQAAALAGSWQYAEDRTAPEHGRDPRERPPLGTRFQAALEDGGAAIVVEHVRQGATRVTRVALDGSETVRQEGETSRSSSGRLQDGALTMIDRVTSGRDGAVSTYTTEFTLTPVAEGLLVRMLIPEPLRIERTALYRRAEEFPAAAQGDLSSLAWLAGRFISDSRASEGQQVLEEHWGPPLGGAMLGTARTVKGGRMASFEFLRIVERDGGLVYVAQPGGGPPVEFVLTELGPARALFENPHHDYPKRILYEHLAAPPGGRDGLRTEISDTGGAQAWAAEFTRAE